MTSVPGKGDLLPLGSAKAAPPPMAGVGMPTLPTIDAAFIAGDVRANEVLPLTAMHTLFMREHNRLADEIAGKNPGLNDEEIYQRAIDWGIP